MKIGDDLQREKGLIIQILAERRIAPFGSDEKQDRDRMYTEFLAYWANLMRKSFRARFLRLITSLESPALAGKSADEEPESEP